MRISCLDSENGISVCQVFREKGKIVTSIIQSSIKGVVIIFISLVLLTVLSYSQWSDGLSFVKDGARGSTATVGHQNQPSGIPPTTIIVSCPVNTAITTYHRAPHAMSSPSPSPLPFPSQNTKTKHNPSRSPSCPNFFRYIHEDLNPWKSTGITKEMVESAKRFANFRLVVIDGKAYLEKYSNSCQTGDVFTIWGILQLLNRYLGRVPDLDLMFNCNDTPVIKAANYRSKAPPPLFRFCKDGTSLEIVFPDWSFWGWAELNIKPWNLFLEDVRNACENLKWKDRVPYALWKGNPGVAKVRQDLTRCNLSNRHDWNARLFSQAEDLGKGGSLFTQEELSMENIYDYMIHILREYAKLLTYKPTIPEKATSICIESMACSANGLMKKFMLESMVKSVYDFDPCSLLAPFDKKELDAIASRKEYLKEVEEMENLGKL